MIEPTVHFLLFMDQQDEYEELLRYAVVTPKFETLTSAHLKHLSTSYLSADGRTSHRKDDIESQHPAGILVQVPLVCRTHSYTHTHFTKPF